MAEFERVVIVGVGLLGGSIGLALRDRNLARTVVGVGRRPESLEKALQRGAVDRAETALDTACQNADLAIICTPVQSVADYVAECQRQMPAGCLITDVGSTKRGICSALDGAQATSFCGSHPLAGSDRSGVDHAAAQLFDDKLTVVTPTSDTPHRLIERTEQFWKALGCRTVRMSPEEHDEAVARTSHLPHLVAAALAKATPVELLPLAASGWCDTTRVAAGNTEMWQQILLENQQPILESLRGFSDALHDWMTALENGNAQLLKELLEAGKAARDSVGN